MEHLATSTAWSSKSLADSSGQGCDDGKIGLNVRHAAATKSPAMPGFFVGLPDQAALPVRRCTSPSFLFASSS